MPLDEASAKRYARKSPFLAWCEREGLPVIGGYGVDDLKSLPLGHWDRWGGPAAYCHLEGSQGFVGMIVAEIPPGKSLKPMRHMYEEQVLVLSGRGATEFWSPGSKEPITLEWQAGSLFSPPLNVLHQHHNGSATEPARFAAANNLPLIMNVYGSAEFVFGAPFDFTERFAGQRDFFSGEMKPGEQEDRAVNFIPDVHAVKLDPHPERGAGFSRLGIHLAGNSMYGHIMAIESGTYKKAHRHAAGAQVIVLAGKGYSLMWHPGREKEMVRVDWRPGSLLVPPEGWYHHHFTTSREAARHLALRRGLRQVGYPWRPNLSEREGGHLLEHEDEPPEIRAMYEAELKKEGIPFRMAPLAPR
ncbi:MAG TPA: ethanolamine ammonia lyase-activating protein [candidate division Zixibacteria bacterium]|nr:ethanolamine ammonia lyase-activating protein [candidate division Zixibacteria bacterium]